MANELLVVDTSVIVKWFKKDEEAVAPAEVIKIGFLEGKFEIQVPDLIFYELGNVLLFYTDLNPQEACVRLEDFFSLGLSVKNLTADLAAEALNIAYEYKLTFYDACFIATANQSKGQFITADKQLYLKVKNLPNVHSLQDMAC